MKGYTTLFALVFIFLACAQTQNITHVHETDKIAVTDTGQCYASLINQNVPDSAAVDFIPAYDKLKGKISAKRNLLLQSYQQAATENEKEKVLDAANAFLQEALLHNVFPFWYGTAWDFNGITDRPQRGQIACGYFVSTTLKHCGVNLNRYKVAQQYSHSIVKTLCTDATVYTHVDQVIAALKNAPNQVYVVGMDNHVGFIAKTDSGIMFIHSSYFGDAVVESARAEQSAVLAMSTKYVIGNLSGNRRFIEQWLKNTPVVIAP